MGPKVSFSQEEIIEAAINLIRKKGESALTARNIAAEMNGSTQPIYRTFGTMENLESELIKNISAIAQQYMYADKNSDEEFLSIGMGYFNFAEEEPELFKYIFMAGRMKFIHAYTENEKTGILKKMRIDKFLKELDDETLLNLLRDMSIYSHGLVSLFITGQNVITKELYLKLLEETGEKLVTYEILKKKNIINTDEIKRMIKNECNNN